MPDFKQIRVITNKDMNSKKFTGLVDGAAASQDSCTVLQMEVAVAGAVTSEMSWKGGYDAATNTPDLDTTPSGIKKGDAYRVTVAGDFFADNMEIGDSLIADQDDPTTLAHWTRVQANRGVDDLTIEVSGINYQLKNDGVTGEKLAPAIAGSGLNQDGSGNLDVGASNDSVTILANGIAANTPNSGNKNMTASITTSDNDQATTTTMSDNPAAGSYPDVRVGGISQLVGDGAKVAVDCYFSGDAGVTARAFSAIAAGDTLHWNGSVAGFELAVTDRIDVMFNA